MKDLEAYATDFQTYLSLWQISSIVNSVESFLKSLVKDENIKVDTLSLSFSKTINKLVSGMQQFGSIQVQKKTCHVPLIRQKDRQAQLVGLGQLHIKSVNDIKLNLVQSIKIGLVNLKGCEILPDGKMLLGQSGYGGPVLVFSSEGIHLFDIPSTKNSVSMDVACIDNTSKIAISRGFNKFIDIVDIIEPLVVHKRITTDNYCHEVTYNDDTLVCCIKGIGIRKISLDDYKVSNIGSDDSNTLRYVAIHNNKLYYTDRHKHTVTCCDMDGRCYGHFETKQS